MGVSDGQSHAWDSIQKKETFFVLLEIVLRLQHLPPFSAAALDRSQVLIMGLSGIEWGPGARKPRMDCWLIAVMDSSGAGGCNYAPYGPGLLTIPVWHGLLSRCDCLDVISAIPPDLSSVPLMAAVRMGILPYTKMF